MKIVCIKQDAEKYLEIGKIYEAELVPWLKGETDAYIEGYGFGFVYEDFFISLSEYRASQIDSILGED